MSSFALYNFRLLITPALLLYSPIGLILVAIRSLLLIYVFLASVILYTVPPIKRFVLRSMCSLLGFIVTSEGVPASCRERPIVSNCATLLDHMALNLLTNCVTPYKFMLSWALTWRQLNYNESSTQYDNKISDVFHLQPEETPVGTDRKIVLKFNPAPFKLFNMVQPVVISVSQYLPINLSLHPLDWKYETFWFLFSPVIWVHVKFLPPISRVVESGQSCEEFAEVVRKEIAQNLHYQMSDMDKNKFWSYSEGKSVNENLLQLGDKYEEQDRSITENHKNDFNNSNTSNIDSSDPRIGQVMAVLPKVDCNHVRHLLDQMKDVDSVIAHLLEQPDSIRIESETEPVRKYVAPSCFKIAASSFSRNPEERHKTLKDRKSMFLENARQRYLDIHKN